MIPAALTDRSELVAALEMRGCKVRGPQTTCPWHDDKTPSAGIICGDDGVWRINCLVCQKRGNLADLLAEASGKDSREIFVELSGKTSNPSHKSWPVASTQPEEREVHRIEDKAGVAAYASRLGKVESWHKYGTEDDPVLVVARIAGKDGKKTFRQFSPYQGGWAPENLIHKGEIPLYKLCQFTDGPMLVVEGEKCVDACWRVGIQATTSAMGSANAGHSQWSTLKGRKVVIWPDHDEAGAKYAAAVIALLADHGGTAALIDPEEIGMPKKGDVADYIAGMEGRPVAEIAESIRAIMDAYAPADPLADLLQLARDRESGIDRAIEWPELDLISDGSKALRPGTVTVFCADPGAGKSLLMVQMVAGWTLAGIQASVLMLEDVRATHLLRVLAQIDGRSELCDDDFARTHAGSIQIPMGTHRRAMELIAPQIVSAEDKPMTLTEISAWVDKRMKAGDRVVAIDPVSAAVPSKEPWIADLAFVSGLKALAGKYRASVICVTHPRGGKKVEPSQSAIAGGSAYSRFAHSILWMEKHEARDFADVGGNRKTNRTMHILKARHGRGEGAQISMHLQSDTLRIVQLGLQPAAGQPPVTAVAKKAHRAKPHKSEDLF